MSPFPESRSASNRVIIVIMTNFGIEILQSKAPAMNKKVQKQLEVAKKKLANLQQQLSGAKQQPDDPADVPRLEKEIANLHAEITQLKSQE